MHILSEHDTYNAAENEKISANDFFVDLEDVDALVDFNLVARANAQAWDDEENDLSIASITHNIENKVGTYDCTFKTQKNTEITIKVHVVAPVYVEDAKKNIGISAFDFFVTADEVKESMAISTDLKTWASAEAWNLQDDSEIEITDVKFDFDTADIEEGSYEITFATQGREYKIETTTVHEEGDKVGLKFDRNDIHVMSKMVV